MIPKPDVPGSVIRFAGSNAPRILPSAAATVAVPLIHDWGPVGDDSAGTDGMQGGPQLLGQFSEWTGLYGDSDTAGRTAVAGAFAGRGLPGQGGAGGVLAYRLAGAGRAVSTVAITGRGTGTPSALRLDGYYAGVRGNRISYSIDNDPSDASKDRLRILFDGVVVDTYVFDIATMVLGNLASLINARSRLVRATALLPAYTSRLTQGSASLAGGNNGTVATQDHLDALEAIKFKLFGILSPYDCESAPLLAAYVSWLAAELTANRPVRMVVGGVAGEVLADAIARSATFTADVSDHIVNLGIGTYHDPLIDKDLSTAQLAPRLAGIIASAGESHSATFAEIGGLTAIVGPAEDELAAAINGGVTVLGQTSSPDADLHIVKCVSAYTVHGNAAKPYDVFSDPRLVGIMDNYIRNMKQWGDKIVIGDLPVNDDTRAEVRARAGQENSRLLRDGLILPADATANPPVPAPWVICEDPGDPSLRDALPYTFGFVFAFTANAILGEGQVL